MASNNLAVRFQMFLIEPGDDLVAPGNVFQPKDGIEIKLRNQDEALLNIAKHLGMFMKKVEHTGKKGGPIPIEIVAIEIVAPTALPAPGDPNLPTGYFQIWLSGGRKNISAVNVSGDMDGWLSSSGCRCYFLAPSSQPCARRSDTEAVSGDLCQQIHEENKDLDAKAYAPIWHKLLPLALFR